MAEPATDDFSWLTEALAGAPRSRQHIDGPRSDRFLWEEATEGSQAMQSLVEDTARWPAFSSLLQDVFQTFYKVNPQLRSADAVDPTTRANRPYVEQILEEPATATTRTQTMLDELAAAVATLVAGRQLAETLAEQPALDEALTHASPPPPQVQGQLAKQLRRAVQAAGDEAQDLQQQLITWGLDGAALQTMPLGERLTFAQQLRSPRFRQMAAIIGRMRHLARARQGGALRHLRDEMYQITQGADLGRLLPVELAALRHPVRRKDFGRRLLEGQLQQYDVRPIRREGHGPILCAVDCSGSMDGPKMDWAVAVGLALLDTARRQRRDFAAVFFNGTVAAAFHAPKGQLPPPEILRFAQVRAEGGTQFEPPLRWALAELDTARFKNADLTLISDGESRLDAAFRDTLREVKAKTGFRIFSILIGGVPEELTRWSDRVWALGGTLDDNAAGDVFAELVIA